MNIQCISQMPGRIVVITKLFIQSRKFDAGFGQLLAASRPSFQQRKRTLWPIGIHQERRESPMTRHVVGSQIETLIVQALCLLHERRCILRLPNAVVSRREVVVCIRIRWIFRERILKLSDRALVIATLVTSSTRKIQSPRATATAQRQNRTTAYRHSHHAHQATMEVRPNLLGI